MEEIWMDVMGYEKLYQISNFGNLMSLRKNRLLIPLKDKDGYLRVQLKSNGKTRFFGIHRLVALHFVENHENKPQVNHLDFNTSNNYSFNLTWVTDKENKEYSLKHGRKNGRKKGYKVLVKIKRRTKQKNITG